MLEHLDELQGNLKRLRIQLAIASVRTGGKVDPRLMSKISEPEYQLTEDEEELVAVILEKNR